MSYKISPTSSTPAMTNTASMDPKSWSDFAIAPVTGAFKGLGRPRQSRSRYRQEVYMPSNSPPSAEESAALYDESKQLQARIATKHGDIVFDFYPDHAPGTVAAFIKLARAKFYDGLNFH